MNLWISLLVSVIVHRTFHRTSGNSLSSQNGTQDSLIAISLHGVTSLSHPDYEATSSEWSDPQPHVHFYMDRQNHCYYWTDGINNIYRTDCADGYFNSQCSTKILYTVAQGRDSFYTGPSGIKGMALDISEQLLMFTEHTWMMKILHLRTGYVQLTSSVVYPSRIRLNTERKSIYWIEDDIGAGSTIKRSQYNGTGIELILRTTEACLGDYLIANEHENIYLFWCDFKRHTIIMQTLNTNAKAVLATLDVEGNSTYCTLAHSTDTLYFTFESTNRTIFETKYQLPTNYAVIHENNPTAITELLFDTSAHHHRSSSCQLHKYGCSDLCLPTPMPLCSCVEGERLLEDKKTCTFANGKMSGLLYTTNSSELCYTPIPISLHHVSVSLAQSAECTQVYLPESAAVNIKALLLDYHPVLAVDEYQSIVANISTGVKRFSYIGPVSFDSHIGGICVDWTVGNVYWTDTEEAQIWVSRYGGVYMNVLIDGLQSPSFIVLDTTERMLYWTETTSTSSVRIRCAEVDGSNVQLHAHLNVTNMRSMHIDYTDHCIFVHCDQGLIRISLKKDHGSSLIDGHVTETMQQFALFQNTFIRSNDDGITFYDRLNMNARITLYVRGSINTTVTSMLPYYHPTDQKITVKPNECMHNNGGCEHVCLPTLDSFRCACRFGRFLDKDEKSCVSSDVIPEEFLLLSSSSHRTLFTIRMNGNIQAVKGIPINDRPVVAKYSPQSGYIYWMINVEHYNFTSTRFSIIKRKLLSHEQSEIQTIYDGILGNNTVTNFEILHSDGKDLIYYLDASLNQLRLLTGDGRYTMLIAVGLADPEDITIDPKSGRVFVSSSDRVISMNLDGSEILMICRAALTGIAWNPKDDALLWCDRQSGDVTSYNITSGATRTVVGNYRSRDGSQKSHTCDFSISNDKVYWVDDTARGIRHVNNADKQTYIRSTSKRMMYTGSIQYVNLLKQDANKACAEYNCSHICVVIPGAVRCLCPQFRSREQQTSDPCMIATFKTKPEIEEVDWYGTDFGYFDHDVLMSWSQPGSKVTFGSKSVVIMSIIAALTLIAFVFAMVMLACKCKKKKSAKSMESAVQFCGQSLPSSVLTLSHCAKPASTKT